MQTFELIRPGIKSSPTLMFRNVEEAEKVTKSREEEQEKCKGG
jgi:hypothetical protein